MPFLALWSLRRKGPTSVKRLALTRAGDCHIPGAGKCILLLLAETVPFRSSRAKVGSVVGPRLREWRGWGHCAGPRSRPQRHPPERWEAAAAAREGAAAKRGFVAAARAAGPGRPGARGRPAPGARGPAGRPARQSRPGRRARASAQLPGTRGRRAAAAGRRLRPGGPRPVGKSGRSGSARRGGGVWRALGPSRRALLPAGRRPPARAAVPREPGLPARSPARPPARVQSAGARASQTRWSSREEGGLRARGPGGAGGKIQQSPRSRCPHIPTVCRELRLPLSVLVSIETPASGPSLMNNGLGPSEDLRRKQRLTTRPD